jgi:peptidyl-dipeptidase Dcp
MKNLLFVLILIGLTMAACNQKEEAAKVETSDNPFFVEYDTPFGVPPFDKIKTEHYLPAYKKGIEEKDAEIKAIAENKEEPTFENTVVALDNSGDLLRKVDGVFSNLNSSMTNEEMQKIAEETTPMISKLYDDIYLNDNLFQRIKKLYENRDDLNLNNEQMKLLTDTYKSFVRSGANLDEKDKARLREINEKISMLTLKFGENVLKETNKFELVIDKEEDLAGLPESVRKAAAETAKEKGMDGKWVFTIQKPSLIPFLQYSEKRDLREKMLKAYINQGNNDDELDNKKILTDIVNLRIEKAKLLGYESHAQYILEENMAKNPQGVYDLLNKLWEPALANAKKEAVELQKMIDKEGGKFKLEPWDWWYYAEKLRKEKFDLDEEQLRPYFKLENVIEGVKMVSNKLYGITLEERKDLPKYHEDVKVFEVKEADGSHIGILYTDYFPRESKRGGAWMNAIRKQAKVDGKMITPIICNVGNFTKPTAEKPSLLSMDETLTLFHEFGHALHGLLSDCTYRGLSGTSVARDWVELPSQIMENWATEPEVLKMYAKHYETGEVIPDELVEKIQKSEKFNQGFVTVEYLAAAYLDMDWHTQTEQKEFDANAFEKASMDKIGMIPEIVVRYRSPYFRHIFSGGYSAGYYSYIWSGVLDTDAFQAFKETSLFDQETAKKFREFVLSKGGTEDPMELYKKFRGREPDIKPLLEKRGLTQN